MNDLPQDPVMLLGVVNTRLRDTYPSLEELCAALDVDPRDLLQRLAAIDYHYDPALNQFK